MSATDVAGRLRAFAETCEKIIPYTADGFNVAIDRIEAAMALAKEAVARLAEVERERDELRAAIFGSANYDPTVRHGQFVEMARDTEAGRLGAIARAEAAEARLQQQDSRAVAIETYYARQIDWSRETFGPSKRTGGVLDHIRKELLEIEAKPDDLSEWVDVIILAMDGFWRHGGTADALLPALLAKQTKNMARTWPDWRGMSESSAIEHDRSADALLSDIEGEKR